MFHVSARTISRRIQHTTSHGAASRVGASAARRTALAGAIAMCTTLSLMTSCQTATPQPLLLSEQAVSLDVPMVHQDEMYACGLASITTLCRYWDIEIPEQQREELSRTAEHEAGLSGNELCAALEQLGMETHMFQGALDHSPIGLYRHVDAGRPPLVMLARPGANQHYCLVVGYDEPRGNLILLDPVQGRVLTPTAIFTRDWGACQRFTLLACGQEALPFSETSTLASNGAATSPSSDATLFRN